MISVISYEVNECMKHMLLNDILQLVVLLDNYTTYIHVHTTQHMEYYTEHYDVIS